jgi:CheY-like chemotaxis protein
MIGDPDRLQQAVWNLLSNAVKFCEPHGRVEVRLWAGSSRVHLSVRDTGRGIDPQFLPHVFDRFRQADSSYTRSSGGLGLGLAIVRSVVELHGGTVQATSAGEGEGSTFSITLPVASTQPERRQHPDRREDAATLRLDGIRVLVVDDEDDERDLLHVLLTSRGAEVELAASAADAVRRIHDWCPTVVVTDLAMPEQDGYALLRRLRSLEAPFRSVPAVAVTAHARVEDRTRALAAGFQAYVPKPIDHLRLVRVIRELAHRSVESTETP